MEFLLLGPLEVRRDGHVVELRGAKRRAVLALLILRANEVVRTDRLVDELWGDHPPSNAPAALQNHVSRLRKDLGSDVLVTKPWGYVLRADPDAIDLRRFERLVAEARTLAAHERQAKLTTALALWRGAALADVADEPALAPEIARLEELHLSALEQRIDTDLELGAGPELVSELERLVAANPLRERLRGQLILALYRNGRQAEALETFRETRRVLVEELGIEPSPELRELERAILRQDPALSAPRPPAPRAAAAEARPRRSRWSLALGGAALLLAGGGGAVALVAATGGSPARHATPAARAAPPRSRSIAAAANHRPRRVRPAPAPEPTARTAHRPATRQPVAKPTTTVVVQVVQKSAAPSEPAPKAAANASTKTRTVPRPEQKPEPKPRPPVTTTATTTSKPTPAPIPFTISDDFAGASFDPVVWHVIGRDFGAVFDQSDGRLEITLSADAQPDPAWNQVGGHYGTQCQFTGDFDASVDFELLTWPAGSGAFAGLMAYFANAGITRQSSAQWGDQYGSWVGPAGNAIALADPKGRLRMRRVGTTITTYFWYRDAWRKMVSGRSSGAATLGLQLQANGDEFSHSEVQVAFDNFTVQAIEATCPPGSDPRNR